MKRSSILTSVRNLKHDTEKLLINLKTSRLEVDIEEYLRFYNEFKSYFLRNKSTFSFINSKVKNFEFPDLSELKVYFDSNLNIAIGVGKKILFIIIPPLFLFYFILRNKRQKNIMKKLYTIKCFLENIENEISR